MAMLPNSNPEAPLRIAQLNSLLTGGGTDDQCVKLSRQLQELSQQVWLAGPDGREVSKTVKALNIPFCATPREGFAKLGFIFAAARLLRRERIQVVHGHHGRDIWPTILAARLSGVRPRIVLTRHMAKSPSSWVSRRFLLAHCDAIIAVSQFVAKVLREGAYEPDSPEPERRARPPLRGDYSKIHVIQGGIDTNRFCPRDASPQRNAWGLAPEMFAFAVVGGYDAPRGKGQREFLRAAAAVQDKIPDARFLIIGRGNLQAVLEKDIADLGLTGRALLTPWCQDMPMTMNAIDCLVHPQIGTEAFPGVLLEAFACGKPVIATRLDGIPEAFAAGSLGELVSPESVPELAEAMVRRVRAEPPGPQQRQELHDRLEAGFSLRVPAAKVLRLYDRLLGKKSVPDS